MEVKILDILKTIRNNYKDKTDDFLKGFDECAELVRISISKNKEQYNLMLKNKELSKKIELLQKTIYKQDVKILTHVNELGALKESNKRLMLFDYSPTPIVPIDEFREYNIKTANSESFNIVANISEQVLNSLSKEFASKYTFNTTNDCKLKLINFINTKNSIGIFASGNLKKAYRRWKL